MPTDGKPPHSHSPGVERQKARKRERLERALRDNLKRRKAKPATIDNGGDAADTTEACPDVDAARPEADPDRADAS